MIDQRCHISEQLHITCVASSRSGSKRDTPASVAAKHPPLAQRPSKLGNLPIWGHDPKRCRSYRSSASTSSKQRSARRGPVHGHRDTTGAAAAAVISQSRPRILFIKHNTLHSHILDCVHSVVEPPSTCRSCSSVPSEKWPCAD